MCLMEINKVVWSTHGAHHNNLEYDDDEYYEVLQDETQLFWKSIGCCMRTVHSGSAPKKRTAGEAAE